MTRIINESQPSAKSQSLKCFRRKNEPTHTKKKKKQKNVNGKKVVSEEKREREEKKVGGQNERLWKTN